MKNRFISLDYLNENFGGDSDFILELLKTSQNEFIATLQGIEKIEKENQFDGGKIYHSFHKFKPAAIMFDLEVKNYFETYGSSQNTMDYPTFISIKPELVGNLQDAISELNSIVESYQV